MNPANDMDENLSKVLKDYGKLRGTKKLKFHLMDCWAQ